MKVSFNRQLYIGFAVSILLLAFITATTYKTSENQKKEADWVEHTHEVVNHIKQLQLNILMLRSNARAYSITADTGALSRYKKLEKRIATQMRDLRRMMTDNPGQVKIVDSMELVFDEFVAARNNAAAPLVFPSRETISSILLTDEKNLNELRELTDKLAVNENKLLVTRKAKSNQSSNLVNMVLIGGMIVVLGIVTGLMYVIRNEFKRRKFAEIQLTESFAELEQLNTESVQKNWLLTGLAELNNALQGSNTLAGLGDGLLKSLTQYLGLPAAALYIVEEPTDKHRLLTTLGVSGKISSEHNSNNSGLIAHAISQRKLYIAKDIPANYWRLQSALGDSVSGQLAFLPVEYKGQVEAVIELGSFNGFNRQQVNFLEMAANSIAVAINSAQSNERVARLLEQVQEQSHILINQQEELRQANEELTSQTEILTASEEELKVREEELRQINAELEEKNEAVELARQDLSLKAKELEIAGKYKSEFLANMSHELRTPLNSILILAKLLSENKSSNLTDKQVEYTKIIHKSGSDLLELINDILDLSKIEAGKSNLQVETVALKDVDYDISQLFKVVASEKKINFTAEIDETAPETIQTDKQKLEQILKNLLSNAFKFTAAGGKIKLVFGCGATPAFLTNESLKKYDRLVCINVKDNGIGIAKEKQQVIFEAFQQADGSTNRKYGGTGLGLSICRELVKILGGELHLHSEEGKGSTFSVYLPLNGPAEVVGTDAPAIDLKEETVQEPLITQLPALTANDDRADIEDSDKTLLIVEDDKEFASILADFAREKNFKVLVALQGDEGLMLARKYKPAAIILDLHLPVIDGFSLLKIFKQDDALANIPVHVISASEDVGKTLSKNVMAYLQKPVTRQQLDDVFSQIGKTLKNGVKRILVLSGDYLSNDVFRNLVQERFNGVVCDYMDTVESALIALEHIEYDCIVADAGANVNAARFTLKKLDSKIGQHKIPVILYIDAPLSPADELEFKKMSDVIIHDADLSKERLMNELELFLYKIQQQKRRPVAKHTAAPVTGVDAKLYNKKVLLVDDDMRNLFALSSVFEEQKMHVITASDGRDALEQLKENKDIDIVLMDIMMPEMDGYEAMRKIRNELQLNKLPVIALTAKAMTGDKEKCIEAGASDYISKPVDVSKLLSLMCVWIA
ncbi:hybrid sensor histidine kinase/response regulator [Foetidibacter luteolus]|uniref:hybrid sensor histidine kinase/response regulator n=1 Tax=Foetidibacter luteolus TaxID=2608880 RepID=UPI00129BCC5D|nr:response regulator [Foetidibacter luteolus]